MALLLEAQSRQLESVIALSCDLPYLDHSLLARLCQAATADYDAVAPRWTPPDRSQPIWEPLCARYFCRLYPLCAPHFLPMDRRCNACYKRPARCPWA